MLILRIIDALVRLKVKKIAAYLHSLCYFRSMISMNLPEAVRRARTELGLSQKRLSELSGVQRRQLATLESGGNVTLSTLRKVLAQLPNLESFTIETVTASVRSEPAEAFQKRVREAMRLIASTLQNVADSIATNGISDEELAALRRYNAALERDRHRAPEENARLEEALATGDEDTLLEAVQEDFAGVEGTESEDDAATDGGDRPQLSVDQGARGKIAR
jgi:predicted transcriptional regulator